MSNYDNSRQGQRHGGYPRDTGGRKPHDGRYPPDDDKKIKECRQHIADMSLDEKDAPRMYDEWAKKMAECLKGVNTTQFRRLFNEMRRLERMLGTDDKRWDRVYPSLKLLKSKVSYAMHRARESAHKDHKGDFTNLKEFLHEGIDLAKEPKHFRSIMQLVEAVYGFYYPIAKKK